MIGLLQDRRIAKYDILAIQEPWKNTQTYEGYNPANSPFHLLQETTEDARTAIYVNKAIALRDWSEIHQENDLISIRLSTKSKEIYIHCVYIEPKSHSDHENPPILGQLARNLEKQGEHIVLGDFNLHYPLWNDPTYLPHHYIADSLLDIVGDIGAELITPRGLATRNCQRGTHHEKTTIDLAFTTLRSIVRCGLAEGLEHGSDHIPIESIFDIVLEKEQKQRLLWKNLDIDVFLSILDRETLDLEKANLTTIADIDRYIEDLTRAIQYAIKGSVPLKRGSTHDKGFWTTSCYEAVKTTRYMRRQYTREPTEQNWQLFTRQRNRKGKILSRAKRDFYRERLRETQETPWNLFKWAKSQKREPISLPTLRKDGIIAISATEKSQLLRAEAFPEPREAELDDILTYNYPDPLETSEEISIDEIQRASLRTKPDKALGQDGIPNRVLHILARHRITLLQRLFQACWDQSYHPIAYHQAITVFLRKPGKEDYSEPKNYRPIALLNSIGKALESIVAYRLKNLAEENALLPDSQYGARPKRSTETALFQLTEKIKAIQQQGLIPSLLALDVQKAFDNVSRPRLLHDLKKSRVPTKITTWINSFLSERSTSVKLADYISPIEAIRTGIPQGSPLSPILYLFYNADLLRECKDIRLSIDPTGFVDDVTILTYSSSIVRNVQNLEKAYDKCLKWAKTHGSKFNPDKTELIHFSRKRKYPEGASIALEGFTIEPSQEIKILGVYLDKNLSPNAQRRAIERKAPKLLSAMKRLTQSTWGLSLDLARNLYLRAVRPAISYGAIAWLPIAKEKTKSLQNKLNAIQGRFLRVVTGAYRATATEALEIETLIEPLDLYIEKTAISSLTRLVL